jgi:hypothetical protein
MKKPAAILVLQYWYTILVLPVFYQYLSVLQYWYYQYFPESSSICNTGITSIFQNLPVSTILIFRQCLVSSSIADTGTSIADTGRFWKILVIPVLQILED